jgi:hypothetical protein
MERETIDWDAIVSRARDQREQQPIPTHTLRVAMWAGFLAWSLGFIMGTVYVGVFGWPW